MPFKFKLSKRLALIKAALAASAVLALACDRSDLTSPQPPPRLHADAVTTLPVASVTASANDGNIPQNTLDNNLATRWAASGDGQWIRYDLGAVAGIGGVDIAWYLGDMRSAHFDIQVSLDTVTWTTVFSGQSSGQTLQFETYVFPTVSARYVRIVGHGQWNGTTLASWWIAITEAAIPGSTLLPPLPVASVTASANDGNIPQNTLDNNLATRWAAWGDGQWIRYDLGAVGGIGGVDIAWYLGDMRSAHFDIQVSLDTVTWTTVFSGQSSGQTLQFETYVFPTVSARYVRIVGHGQWNGTTLASWWIAITEAAIQRGTNVSVASVTVSPASAGILVGATVQLAAVTKDSAGNTLTGQTQWWASGNTAVATVSASGLVTAVAAGSATINATSGGKSAGATVTVSNVPVASVVISPATATLLLGASLQLSATVKDSAGNVLSGRTVTWTSSAPAVASVSASGLVSGLAAGTAPITATSGGVSGAAAITATDPPSTSTAHQYYGAPTGSDANPCSATSPCYTMQRVSQLMSPGDTAHFAAGNYTWNYSGNKVSKSGTASGYITYISDTKWGAKITGTDCSPITNNGAYVQIIGFDVTGNCPQGITTGGSYSKIIGNRVHDMPGSSGGYGGIVAPCCNYMAVTGIQIIGNVVDNIGPWGQVNLIHGIYVASPYAVVENNIVTRGAAACIQSYHGATHQIISNNTVANCGRYGITISADPALTTNDYTTVDNNIIVNSGGYGIFQGYSLGSHNVFSNNILYNTPSGDISSPESGTSAIQSGNITLTSTQFTALFVNYTGDITGDYHLRSGAVAIDRGTTACVAGVTICVPSLDFDGILRRRGMAYDIGAYEY